MYGPFEGARSPYHLTEKKDFFKTAPNRLCMVCHKHGTNSNNLKVYATGDEYLEYKKSLQGEVKSCVECHMSGEKKGIASNYKGKGGMVERLVRDHLFAGIASGKLAEKYINMSAKLTPDGLAVEVSNLIPHKLPTGYGLREVELQILFYSRYEKLIKKRGYSFSVDWLDKHGKLTIPHLAKKIGEDRRLAPLKSKKFIFSVPPKTKIINYKLIYRRVQKKFIKKLKIRDRFFINETVLKNGILEP
jgi:hypothetical protein